jgi:hypothetical protein
MTGGWRKSSYSGDNGGDCVECATTRATVLVRDTKSPATPALAFTPRAWQAFTTSLK